MTYLVFIPKKIMISKHFLFFLLIFLSVNISNSQSISSLKKDYLWFDKQIGIENTTLFNGLRYEEKFRVIDGNHKFYLSSEFLTGDIVYDGQPFYDIKMKYDLFEDQLIINLITNSGNNNIIKLLNTKLDGFTLKGKEFIKLHHSKIGNSNEELNGIFEILSKNPKLILYKKNKKIAKKNINKEFLYYTFKNDNQYYCFTNENYYLIDSKKDWIRIFPEQKKEIQSFYNKNKMLLQSDYDTFLIQLSLKLSSTISLNTSPK